MAEPTALAPLVGALRDLVRWLRAAKVRAMIIGGVAASLLGRPRFTGDVDAMILLDDERWEAFVAAGARFGFRPRRSRPRS